MCRQLVTRALFTALVLLITNQTHICSPIQVNIGDQTPCKPLIDPQLGGTFLPVWSPDGKQLAYATFDSHKITRIWIADKDDSNPRLLVDNLEFPPGINLTWSPNSKQLAFVAIHRDVRSAVADYSKSDLYTVDAAGGQPKLLVETPLISEGIFYKWSSDSATIAFRSSGYLGGKIFLVAVAETLPDIIPTAYGPQAQYFDWSPTDPEIAFALTGNLYIASSVNINDSKNVSNCSGVKRRRC